MGLACVIAAAALVLHLLAAGDADVSLMYFGA
jgi:hypothetical protein